MINNLLIGCFAEYEKETGDYTQKIKADPSIIKKPVEYCEYQINKNKELQLKDNTTKSEPDTPIVTYFDESSELYQNFNNKNHLDF